ncbi:MAG: ParB/RepB/Spo0J family partition protein [Deltaproteobacteria bacterium]|nr:ParB/RepB/Spo0J family partition protein [Deltaproteobacteria bacterium]
MNDIRKKLSGKTTKLAQERPRQEDHPAKVNDYQEGSYYQIDIDLILPDPDQPIPCFDPETLEELANSIRRTRLYQPILVRKDETGQIILVAGKRRLQAAKMAGLEKIPAIFTEGNPLEISIIENLQRENLRPLEEAEILGRLIEQHGYTPEKLALAVGKAQGAIVESLNLNRLPEAIKEESRQTKKYPKPILIEIAKQETTEAMLNLFNRTKQDIIISGEAGILSLRPAEKPQGLAAEKARDQDTSENIFLPNGDLEAIEQDRKTQLLNELKKLVKIIDELII